MGHPSGKGVWRFVHRESGKHLDVVGHTANECMLEQHHAFVVAFGALPDWSQFDPPALLSNTTTVTVQPRSSGAAGNDIPARFVGAERPQVLAGSGRA
jgi:hypothetical protein